ncbi:hypothetical protein ANCCAN_20621 [Ancylostoma caninum]|uniref:Uncharacterized protein n=1 Tax=Ancylostoma caninum TaxID=29170 RepID=A0A368FMZ2_ANCCA|nr:hypothetical protein ANCCAN_20621 [Ancylostoma caninum]
MEVCEEIDFLAEEGIANVFKFGQGIEIHFISVFKRRSFLELLADHIRRNRDSSITAQCHPLSKLGQSWPFEKIGGNQEEEVEPVAKKSRSEKTADASDDCGRTSPRSFVQMLQSFCESYMRGQNV